MLITTETAIPDILSSFRPDATYRTNMCYYIMESWPFINLESTLGEHFCLNTWSYTHVFNEFTRGQGKSLIITTSICHTSSMLYRLIDLTQCVRSADLWMPYINVNIYITRSSGTVLYLGFHCLVTLCYSSLTTTPKTRININEHITANIYYYLGIHELRWTFRIQEREIEPCGSAECSTALQWERDWHQRANPAHRTFTVPQPSPSLRLPACLELWHDHRLVRNIQRIYNIHSPCFLMLDISKYFERSTKLTEAIFNFLYHILFNPGTWVNKGIGSVRMERNGLVWTYVAPHLGNWIAAPSPTSNGMYSQMTHTHSVCNLCLNKVTTGLFADLEDIAILLFFW